MFISITYNSIELTLIVEESARNDFERLQTNSINHSEGFLSPDDIQISPTTWVPLSIDVSQSDRLRDISEPLAKAGISILYHSAMNNDYLFVRTFCSLCRHEGSSCPHLPSSTHNLGGITSPFHCFGCPCTFGLCTIRGRRGLHKPWIHAIFAFLASGLAIEGPRRSTSTNHYQTSTGKAIFSHSVCPCSDSSTYSRLPWT